MVTDDIELDPNYGASLEMWIYQPVSKKWVQLDDPTFFKSLRFDVTDSRFIKSLHWLNLGAMLFLSHIDPNTASVLVPIILPESFLRRYGVRQDNLKDAVLSGNMAVIKLSEGLRAVSDEAFLARKEQAVKLAEEKLQASKPKVVSTDEIIEQLKKDWLPVASVSAARIKLIQRKYELEYKDDLVRIVNEK